MSPSAQLYYQRHSTVLRHKISSLKSSTGLFCNYLKRRAVSAEKQKSSLLENHSKVKSGMESVRESGVCLGISSLSAPAARVRLPLGQGLSKTEGFLRLLNADPLPQPSYGCPKGRTSPFPTWGAPKPHSRLPRPLLIPFTLDPVALLLTSVLAASTHCCGFQTMFRGTPGYPTTARE